MLINNISKTRLNKLFRYNPENGKLFWRKSPIYHIQDGGEAGYIWRGRKSRSAYRYVKINSANYPIQNVIWVMYNGSIPNGFEVDHIDHDGLNNRYKNLRLVPILKNHHNKPKRSDNTSGHTGVYWNKISERWCSNITVNSKRISLGYFSDIADAIQARKDAEVKYDFHPNHGKDPYNMEQTKLEKDIKRYAQSYYEGNQEISDIEFDSLVEQLRRISPNNPILSLPGWGYIVDPKQKVDHIGDNVGSLSKIKYPEICDTCNTIITPKLDGGSIVLYYREGKLVEALTRGDGSKGMSCLKKMQYILPHVQVPKDKLISIRGEIIIPASYHEDLIKRGIPNPRNYANGIINRIEAGEDIKLLRFIPYSIRIYKEVMSKTTMLNTLAEWGFKRIPYLILVSDVRDHKPEDLKRIYEQWSEKFPIDGLVITKIDSLTASKIESGTFAISENAIAYKFESERAQVTVGSVEWQVGETGRIVPVIKLDKPVFLSGANITYITAHNATQVIEKRIGPGAKITIERANEVIPYLVSVDEPPEYTEIPDVCPLCNKTLSQKNMDLVCINMHCKGKQRAKIKAILEICGIPDGFGDVFLDKWIGDDDLTEFIEFGNEIAAAGSNAHYAPTGSQHYDKLARQLWHNVQDKFIKGFSYEEFWKMIRISGLADSHAKKLRSTSPRDISVVDIPEIGAQLNLPSNVIEEMENTYYYWNRIAHRIRKWDVSQNEVKYKMAVVVTGEVSMVRKDFEKYMADNGVELKSSVTKDVKYLVSNQPSDSSKYKKAKQMGIPIINEFQLYKILGLED